MFALKFRWFSNTFKKSRININNINSINIIKKNKPTSQIVKHNLSESHSSKPFIVYKKNKQNTPSK